MMQNIIGLDTYISNDDSNDVVLSNNTTEH